jgi:hypothetical protein
VRACWQVYVKGMQAERRLQVTTHTKKASQYGWCMINKDRAAKLDNRKAWCGELLKDDHV